MAPRDLQTALLIIFLLATLATADNVDICSVSATATAASSPAAVCTNTAQATASAIHCMRVQSCQTPFDLFGNCFGSSIPAPQLGGFNQSQLSEQQCCLCDNFFFAIKCVSILPYSSANTNHTLLISSPWQNCTSCMSGLQTSAPLSPALVQPWTDASSSYHGFCNDGSNEALQSFISDFASVSSVWAQFASTRTGGPSPPASCLAATTRGPTGTPQATATGSILTVSPKTTTPTVYTAPMTTAAAATELATGITVNAWTGKPNAANSSLSVRLWVVVLSVVIEGVAFAVHVNALF